MKRKLSTEVLIILIISIILGLIANFISPKGIALIRDDSDRFAIDSINTSTDRDKSKQTRQYTKEGFIKPQNIKVDYAKKLFDEGIVFIDGRDANEFQQGHIKGAINISYKEFKDKTKEEKLDIMKNFDKEKLIVSYCGSSECDISIDNAYEFAKIGYDEVKIYLGGYKEWNELGYPTDK